MTKRILMVSPCTLFGQGVATWLGEQEGLFLVGCVKDLHEACEQMAPLEPDVVLLDCSDSEHDPTPPLMRFLADTPGARVVSIGLRDNRICMYSAQRRLIGDAADLRQAIMQDNDSVVGSSVR